MELAGDRPPRYDEKTPSPYRRAVGKPVPRQGACTRHPTLAVACPPRYGNIETRGLSYREDIEI